MKTVRGLTPPPLGKEFDQDFDQNGEFGNLDRELVELLHQFDKLFCLLF